MVKKGGMCRLVWDWYMGGEELGTGKCMNSHLYDLHVPVYCIFHMFMRVTR